MAKLSDIQQVEAPQIAVIYGAPLTGKTSAVAILAKKYRLHWFDLDGKYSSIFAVLPKEFHSNIDLYSIRDTPEKARAAATIIKALSADKKFDFCQAHGDLSCQSCMKEKKPMEEFDPTLLECGKDIIVIDNLTALSDSFMSKNLGFIDAFNPKQKEFGHYNRQEFSLNVMYSYATSRGCHVIFISHEASEVQEDGKTKLNPTGGSKAYSTRQAGKIPHVIRAFVENGKFKLSANPLDNASAQAGTVSGRTINKAEDLLNLFTPVIK